jgi:hypothetical protein
MRSMVEGASAQKPGQNFIEKRIWQDLWAPPPPRFARSPSPATQGRI